MQEIFFDSEGLNEQIFILLGPVVHICGHPFSILAYPIFQSLEPIPAYPSCQWMRVGGNSLDSLLTHKHRQHSQLQLI